MSAMRNPMHVKFVNNEMLCALTYFMRNKKKWSVEINTPTVILDNGKTEDREDVRFKIGVEAVYSLTTQQGVPRGTFLTTM
eukprot:2660091-Amphidinium_carterae.1